MQRPLTLNLSVVASDSSSFTADLCSELRNVFVADSDHCRSCCFAELAEILHPVVDWDLFGLLSSSHETLWQTVLRLQGTLITGCLCLVATEKIFLGVVLMGFDVLVATLGALLRTYQRLNTSESRVRRLTARLSLVMTARIIVRGPVVRHSVVMVGRRSKVNVQVDQRAAIDSTVRDSPSLVKLRCLSVHLAFHVEEER